MALLVTSTIDAFVVTAYVPDSIKRGEELWAQRT
jgi:hypothetical protein